MRLKEFIIFIVIFTVCYIVFFVVFDIIKNKRAMKRQKELAISLIQNNNYLLFANFYGIHGTASNELIFSILNGFHNSNVNTISVLASNYHVSNYEFVVIVLYLEYLKLIPVKNISIVENCLRSMSFADQNIVLRYIHFFDDKKSFNDISSSLGGNVINDLYYIDKQFLVPGVRYNDSKIFYVGDYL